MEDKSPVEKVKDQKKYIRTSLALSKQASKNWKLTMQKTRQVNFGVKLQIASTDRAGHQSLIKKQKRGQKIPPKFILYMFLGMRYSAVSINHEEIQVSLKKKKETKTKPSNVRAPKEIQTVLSWRCDGKYNWKCLNKK